MVEITVIIAIVSLSAISLLAVSLSAFKVHTVSEQTDKAGILAKEALEAARNYRDATSWSANGIGTLTPGANYYPQVVTDSASSSWRMALGTESLNGFTRRLVFSNVSRDPVTDNIEATYNALNNDPNTKKVTATVSWNNKSVVLTTYLTNWR